MRRIFTIPACLGWLLVAIIFAPRSEAQEPSSALTMIRQWQYPGSTITGAQLGDAATMNAAGARTIQSIVYKAILTTGDSLSKVLDYYKTKLAVGDDANPELASDPQVAAAGKSVIFQEDSKDRPLGIHIITINTQKASTVIVISRTESESETHIAWMRYQRL